MAAFGATTNALSRFFDGPWGGILLAERRGHLKRHRLAAPTWFRAASDARDHSGAAFAAFVATGGSGSGGSGHGGGGGGAAGGGASGAG